MKVTKRLLTSSALCLGAAVLLAGEAVARPPLFQIGSIADQTAQVGVLFQLQATYTVLDPVCWIGGISFHLDTAPAGMTISSGGKISWTPTSGQGGNVFQVTIHAVAPTPGGDPCWGATGQDFESFLITAEATPPPNAAVSVELTETAINNALASLTEVRGINFGEYLAGFVDAWWVNLDGATLDVLPPAGGVNRVRITAVASANSVFDLFVFNVGASGGADGWIEGDVELTGDPSVGYKLVVHPTNIDLDGWINGVLGWIADIFIDIDDALASGFAVLPDVELNLGTELAAGLTCITPRLTTNGDFTALVLEWDVVDLGCLIASGSPTSACVGVNYLRNDLGLSQATCAAYCSSLGKTCSESCTTNRGYPNWGVEAWVNRSQCEAYSTSGGQARCTTDLSIYSSWSERKYRCCCQ